VKVKKAEDLRDTLLRPFQIPLYLLGILVAFCEPGSRSRETLLRQSLQILKFAVLRIQQSRSVKLLVALGMKKFQNSRLCLDCQSAIERKWIECARKSILHVFLHIYAVGRRCAVILAALASSVTA
jgi:hypothetical protein